VTTQRKSKRTVGKEFVSKTGVAVTQQYCRKCMKTKPPKDFYQATDFELDSNGLQSICKPCVFELYDGYYLVERTLDKALLRLCRTLNVVYDTRVVDSVRKEINKAQEDGRKAKQPFGIYRSRIGAMIARSGQMESEIDHDLTFYEPLNLEPSDESLELMSHDQFWGENYTLDEVEFLDREYTSFKQNYSTDDHATVVLLKRLCKKILAIKQEEDSRGKGVGALEKQLLVLMKDLAISPAHSNAANSGKMADVFGLWVKEIEKFTPAEYMESEAKDLHHDVDNISLYYENYVKRPIRNFMTGNADYNILDEDGNVIDAGM